MSRFICNLHARDTVLTMGHVTRIMGIINCTPDSFSGDGTLTVHKGGQSDTVALLKFAHNLIRDGADIIDVGGESTRPGALRVPVQEEIKRVIPVIKVLARRIKIPISVDTSKLEVARCALDEGAAIVNNVAGKGPSLALLKMVRNYNASIVIMHMRGTPATMNSQARYKNVVNEVIEELEASVEKCLRVGIKKNRIIVDPGIGFAKTIDHNLILIKNLNKLNVLRCPILLGTSRKSFIGQILQNGAKDRLIGTAATVTAGVMQGAHIVRVHDVKAIKETLKVTDAILNAHA